MVPAILLVHYCFFIYRGTCVLYSTAISIVGMALHVGVDDFFSFNGVSNRMHVPELFLCYGVFQFSSLLRVRSVPVFLICKHFAPILGTPGHGVVLLCYKLYCLTLLCMWWWYGFTVILNFLAYTHNSQDAGGSYNYSSCCR